MSEEDQESARNLLAGCLALAIPAVMLFGFLGLLAWWVNSGSEPQATPTESTIPTNATCSDFATQAEAKKALPTNPRLDSDGDGIPCESLPPE
ncbi:excalibur calcium-binding domain-containing protein [Candidatus Dojkabacteria bacterium]|uniref:Excalibur calcium-binding domain-containing protein n=1 Tax=Candidatus Dojkabacteria bacterium TaxID=2099670 RepID=A0A5C7J9U5_9BACT|nr:MAG: excalibur calcium-binding domain-containing protein [Candidatus Dojkabacteria bacterium]